VTIERARISAIVLSGGHGSRLDGMDKGLILLAGRTLVDWVAGRLTGQVDEILVSANRNLPQYTALGHAVVTDTLADCPGPLAGLVAAGRKARHEWLLTVPCDSPFIPPNLAETLQCMAAETGADLVRPSDETGVHFVVMLVRRRLVRDAEIYLQSGGHKVQAWQAGIRNATAHFKGRPFFNINSPDDLAVAEQLAREFGV